MRNIIFDYDATIERVKEVKRRVIVLNLDTTNPASMGIEACSCVAVGRQARPLCIPRVPPLLAPDIQEHILNLTPCEPGKEPMLEKELLKIAREADFERQRESIAFASADFAFYP